MAINPMQRKSRNSFLLGMFIMLVITGIVIAILFLQIINLKKAEQARQKITVQMCVLKKTVKSGDVIAASDIEEKFIETTVADKSIVTLSDLSTKEGNRTVSKIELPAGTALIKNMITTEEARLTDSTRMQEYNMISLPKSLAVGDYIDIRLTLPTGQDYIVVSKKSVLEATERVLKIEMNEEEIMTMSNAIVDAYYMTGAKLYATSYVEPGLQAMATPTYPVDNNIGNLINQDPNVLETAKAGLNARFNAGGNAQRNQIINGVREQYSQTGSASVDSKVIEELTKALEDRTKYLQSLSAGLDY